MRARLLGKDQKTLTWVQYEADTPPESINIPSVFPNQKRGARQFKWFATVHCQNGNSYETYVEA